MKLQVGDKVRFLNEAIEGTVSKVLSNSRVEISTEDGFSQTAFESQLVKVEFEMAHDEKFVPETIHGRVPEEQELKNYPEKKNTPSVQYLLGSMQNDETIYTAVVLVNELSPLTTDIELHLLNNSSVSIVFTLSKRVKEQNELIAADVLHGRSEKFIGMYSQEELQNTEGFSVQMIFFRKDRYLQRPAFEKVFRIESSHFLDSEYWDKAAGGGNRILLMSLKQLSGKEVDIEKLLDKFTPKPEEAEKPRQGKSKITPKYVLLTREKVVDLHIEELMKDYSGLSNAQIISYQINYFLNEMDKAILNRLHKITFIHGVGEGVLKSAIREELKKFDNVSFGDGPVEKFGYGATEVMFG